jgi:hypothetical protein
MPQGHAFPAALHHYRKVFHLDRSFESEDNLSLSMPPKFSPTRQPSEEFL